ncbi:type IV pilus associated TadE family protein [Halobacillus andaensis]|uniref:Type IV pilus associated TadE family protein n=1 Tax=Halobacillus andaensis TaxID=1176239 RepID=A0A917B6Z4_HALAA|nr:TadE/TadG family type IV pilus assembly protein [Halobacillus andaensis]MBP2005078.1 Flp pilus assembly protein TadG [Halobacillus andaensis]GGF28715.1 type IV pilus associated TadE family protein [Halobacillus andaensis]
MVKKEDGQSLVEFALALPILLLLVIGIIDFGRVLYIHLQLELVTQESVRLGGLGQEDGSIRSYAENHFAAGDPSKLEVAITPSSGSRETGDYVTVSISYPERLLQPLGDLSIPYTVETSSTIRIE